MSPSIVAIAGKFFYIDEVKRIDSRITEAIYGICQGNGCRQMIEIEEMTCVQQCSHKHEYAENSPWT